MTDLLRSLDSPELPFLQWQESMSVLATRLPKELRNEASVELCLLFFFFALFGFYQLAQILSSA